MTFFPFLINCTLTHFRIAELGCFASTPTFSRTIPLAWEEPPNGEDLKAVPSARFLYDKSAHRCSRRWFCSLRAALSPRGFPLPMIAIAHQIRQNRVLLGNRIVKRACGEYTNRFMAIWVGREVIIWRCRLEIEIRVPNFVRIGGVGVSKHAKRKSEQLSHDIERNLYSPTIYLPRQALVN